MMVVTMFPVEMLKSMSCSCFYSSLTEGPESGRPLITFRRNEAIRY